MIRGPASFLGVRGMSSGFTIDLALREVTNRTRCRETNPS